jgi:uncharacterized protein
MAMPALEVQLSPAAGGLAPTEAKDRIFQLDVLRGWAILGILAVNAVAFAWPFQVMVSEGPPPGATGQADLIGQWVVEVFFKDKFRTLFTLLFGVSIFLVGGEKTDEKRGALLWRRLLWLGVFGLLHGVVLWYGDILLHYAYCGLLMMLMRSWSARRLLWIGGGVTLLWAVIGALAAWGMANMPAEMAAQMEAGRPAFSPQIIADALAAYRAGWPSGLLENIKVWATFQLIASPFLIPITIPLMMLGLGLFKSGYLHGRAPVWTYVVAILIGGADLCALAVWNWQDVMAGEADPTNGLAGAAGGAPVLITLFYASILILLVRFGLRPLVAWLAPVGRMAFTNYLTQTLIMVTLYYAPWGPMWFGEHGPAEMWAVVGAVWVAQILRAVGAAEEIGSRLQGRGSKTAAAQGLSSPLDPRPSPL